MASIPTTILVALKISQIAATRTLATSQTTDTTPKHRHTPQKSRFPLTYPTPNLPLKDVVTTPPARQLRHLLEAYPWPTPRRGLNSHTRLANISSTKSFRGNENEGKSYTSSRSKTGRRGFRGKPLPTRELPPRRHNHHFVRRPPPTRTERLHSQGRNAHSSITFWQHTYPSQRSTLSKSSSRLSIPSTFRSSIGMV
jgi:hypothetical protein